jgi:hypothetical protein
MKKTKKTEIAASLQLAKGLGEFSAKSRTAVFIFEDRRFQVLTQPSVSKFSVILKFEASCPQLVFGLRHFGMACGGGSTRDFSRIPPKFRFVQYVSVSGGPAYL